MLKLSVLCTYYHMTFEDTNVARHVLHVRFTYICTMYVHAYVRYLSTTGYENQNGILMHKKQRNLCNTWNRAQHRHSRQRLSHVQALLDDGGGGGRCRPGPWPVTWRSSLLEDLARLAAASHIVRLTPPRCPLVPGRRPKRCSCVGTRRKPSPASQRARPDAPGPPGWSCAS